MQYQFDQSPQRRNTDSVKWNYFDPDVLPFWVADMDFISPEPVIRALKERAEHGVFGYAQDMPGLRDAIIENILTKYNWQLAPDDIVFVPGVVTGFNMAAHAFVSPGKGVAIQTPVYMPFLDTHRHVGGIRQESELARAQDGSYTVDWPAFEGSLDENSSMFLLCNPHNPVGRVYSQAELLRMAEICARHDVLICSDEIHCDLVFPGHSHLPIASLDPEISRRTITMMAPSKTYNIAGLSCSFAIIQNPELRKQFIKADTGLVHGVNILGLTAARAAYQEGQEWLDQLREYLDGNRRLLFDFVNHELPGVSMAIPEGTYLAWLDCRDTGLGDRPGDFFHKTARVALTEGSAFGKGGAGFVRMNFGCTRAMLLEGLERMKKALESR